MGGREFDICSRESHWTGRSIKFMGDVAILMLFSSERRRSVSRIRGVRGAISRARVATSLDQQMLETRL